MKLRYSPTSPFVRKVMVTAIETGLDGRMERILTNIRDPASDIVRDNPLGKIPTLITDDGLILYDSAVVCEYLDSLHDGPPLFPPAGRERWIALRRMALADGALDAGILRLMEMWRSENERSPAWIEKQFGKVARGLDALEREAADLDGPITIGHVAIGCLLGWLDFRFSNENWRSNRPRLAEWYEGFADRPSMRETAPSSAP